MVEFLAGAVCMFAALIIAARVIARRQARALGARMVHVFHVQREAPHPQRWDVQ